MCSIIGIANYACDILGLVALFDRQESAYGSGAEKEVTPLEL